MERQELIDALQNVSQAEVGVFVYFVMKNGAIEMANINEEAISGIKNQLLGKINSIVADLNDETFSFLKLSTADERENAIFEYDLPTDNYPSSFRHMLMVRENDENMEYWENLIFGRHDSVKDIYAVIYSIGIDNYNIVTYRKCYRIETFELNSGGFLMFHNDNQMGLVDSPLVKLVGNFDFFLIDNTFIINNLKVLEQYDDVKIVIQNQANQYMNNLDDVDFIDDISVFQDRIANDVSFARKIIKIASTSEVISKYKSGNITKQRLFDFIQSRPTLAESLKIKEGVIGLNTKKAQNAFLRLMDDSYLHSLLTDIDYMSNSKDREN